MDTLRLVCKCGAHVDMVDESWRVEVARDEFEAQHQGVRCKTSRRGRVVHFDGQCWPLPDGDLEHRMRYGEGEPSLTDRLAVAQRLGAYGALFGLSARRIAQVVREVRAAMRTKKGED